jgi:hypothetical protein
VARLQKSGGEPRPAREDTDEDVVDFFEDIADDIANAISSVVDAVVNTVKPSARPSRNWSTGRRTISPISSKRLSRRPASRCWT